MSNAFNAVELELEKFVPNYTNVLRIIISNPDVLREEVYLGRNVLHKVCLKGAPLEVVNECIKGNRGALQQRCPIRWYPLHCACYNGRSESNIRTLVKEYPAAAREKDAIGLYPLHYVLECKLNFALVELLLNVYPAVLQYKHIDSGEYVLHHACRFCECEKVLLLLISSSLHAVKCENCKGETPLCIATKKRRSTKITLLLEQLMERSDEELENRIAIPRIVMLHDICNLRRLRIYDWLKDYNVVSE
jgi:ankyrin repeat protein